MTLPPVGSSLGAQAANTSIAATATAAGGITFVGPSGVQGSTITCVVTVPLAPSTAVFTATLGTPGGEGVVLDTFGGDSTAGQFQILVGQTLVISGTGLGASTQYTCTFGTVTDVGGVQVVIPEPNTSALTAQLFSIGVGSVIYGNVFLTPSGGIVGPVTVTVPVGVRTLILDMSMSDAETITKVTVAGTSSGRYYYNQAPYLFQLFGATNSYQVVVPFIGLVDTQVTIQMTQAGAPDQVDFTVFGDTAQYPESAFYNGIAQPAVLSGTGTLLAGPARLLTCSITSNAGGSGSIALAGIEILLVATASLVAVYDFPPNTILEAGQSLTASQATAAIQSEVVYAYP